MIRTLHFNTETSLGLLFCIVCSVLLFVLTIPLPLRAKQTINQQVGKVIYYLMFVAFLPLWTGFNAIRNIKRFADESSSPTFSPLLADKAKGRQVKMQRNLILSMAGLILFVLLWRFHRVITKYDDAIANTKVLASPAEPSASNSGSGVSELRKTK